MEELQKLPGVGPRSAVRMAQYLLKEREEALRLSQTLAQAHERVGFCPTCFLLAEGPCPVCDDPGRDRTVICVVEEPVNAWAIEATGEFKGLYHVLLGTLDPLRGIGPEELTVAKLVDRVAAGGVQEVILATNLTVEGEATAHFLVQLLRPKGVKTSRIAFGLPAGGEISYADTVTLARALVARRGME
jgi:recombination protein RecR